MNHNLDGLNEMLYKTLEGLQDGSVDNHKAKTICTISSQIISVSKTKIDALRLFSKNFETSDSAIKSLSGVIDLEEQSDVAPKALEDQVQKNLFVKKTKFAKSLGYPSLAKAVLDLGTQFDKKFNNYLENLES